MVMVFYKHVFTRKDYFNISYKKALRLLKKCERKQFLNLVSHWESVSGCSRYKVYFHRDRDFIRIKQEPLLFEKRDYSNYFGLKL